MPRHALFDELDMFCKGWQTRYLHLYDAADAANALDMYYSWLGSAQGQEYRQQLQATQDVWREQQQHNGRETALPYSLETLDAVPAGEDE